MSSQKNISQQIFYSTCSVSTDISTVRVWTFYTPLSESQQLIWHWKTFKVLYITASESQYPMPLPPCCTVLKVSQHILQCRQCQSILYSKYNQSYRIICHCKCLNILHIREHIQCSVTTDYMALPASQHSIQHWHSLNILYSTTSISTCFTTLSVSNIL